MFVHRQVHVARLAFDVGDQSPHHVLRFLVQARPNESDHPVERDESRKADRVRIGGMWVVCHVEVEPARGLLVRGCRLGFGVDAPLAAGVEVGREPPRESSGFLHRRHFRPGGVREFPPREREFVPRAGTPVAGRFDRVENGRVLRVGGEVTDGAEDRLGIAVNERAEDDPFHTRKSMAGRVSVTRRTGGRHRGLGRRRRPRLRAPAGRRITRLSPRRTRDFPDRTDSVVSAPV